MIRQISAIAFAYAMAVGVMAAVAACGGGAQSAPKTAAPKATPAPVSHPVAPNLTDEQQIQNTIREFNQAMLNGDGATACSKMTPAAQQQAVDQMNQKGASPKWTSCAALSSAIGSATAQALTPEQRNAYVNPTFTGTQIGGTDAETAYNDGTSIHRAQLSKSTGSWLLVSTT